jgi:hypothetical protein
MCTVTVVRYRDRDGQRVLRLACNRDELQGRPPALPPERRRCGGRVALLPVDPVSGGTWVAVNDAGLALALLNLNPAPTAEQLAPLHSRGAVIPLLLPCATAAAARGHVTTLQTAGLAPFRVVMADRATAAAATWNGARWEVADIRLPALFTSSGLGDALVQAPRRRLFEETFHLPMPAPALQDSYHRHHWPDRPHLSVCMRRPDARTVSHTVVTVGPQRATLAYRGDAPDSDAEVVTTTLDLTPEEAP